MNIKFLLIAIAAASITSCSTAYKSGQTPDDVYFSPVRGIDEKDNVKQQRDERRDDYRADNYEEREIRMATRDRRWRDLNDYYDYNCYYDPYRYGYNYGYYYNPYYYNRPVYLPGYAIVNPKNTTPRMTNLGSYSNNTLVVSNNKTGQTKWIQSTKSYNNSNNSGSFIRRIITPAGNQSSSGSSSSRNSGAEINNTRTYTPANNNNSSRGSGSSSPAPSSGGSSSGGSSVTRPTRGN
jgi:hypothetical protein